MAYSGVAITFIHFILSIKITFKVHFLVKFELKFKRTQNFLHCENRIRNNDLKFYS